MRFSSFEWFPNYLKDFDTHRLSLPERQRPQNSAKADMTNKRSLDKTKPYKSTFLGSLKNKQVGRRRGGAQLPRKSNLIIKFNSF